MIGFIIGIVLGAMMGVMCMALNIAGKNARKPLAERRNQWQE